MIAVTAMPVKFGAVRRSRLTLPVEATRYPLLAAAGR